MNQLNVTPSLTTLQLVWSPPEEPNGVIISYEISYQTESRVMVANTSHLQRQYTVEHLRPWTTLDVSVSAYTRLGKGVPRGAMNVSTLSRRKTTSIE